MVDCIADSSVESPLDEEERLPIEHHDNCHVDLSSSSAHIRSPVYRHPYPSFCVLFGSKLLVVPSRHQHQCGQSLKVCKFCSHPIDSLGSYCSRLESTGQDSRSSNPQAEQPLALVFVVVLLSCAQNIVTSCHIGLRPILVSPFQISGLCAHKHSIRFQCHPSAESALISTITPLLRQFSRISWVCFQTSAFLLAHPAPTVFADTQSLDFVHSSSSAANTGSHRKFCSLLRSIKSLFSSTSCYP